MPKVIPSQRTALRHVEPAWTRTKRLLQRARAPLASKSEKLRRDFQLDAYYPVLSPGFEQLLGGELVCASLKKQLKARQEVEVIFGVSSLFAAYSIVFDFPIVFQALSAGVAIASALMVFKKAKVIKSYSEIVKDKHTEIQNLILNHKDQLKDPSNTNLRSMFLKYLHTWMSSLSTQDCPVPLSAVIQYSLRLDMSVFDLIESLDEILQWSEIYTKLTPQELGLIIWSIEDALEAIVVSGKAHEAKVMLLKSCSQVRLRMFLKQRTQDPHFPNILSPHPALVKIVQPSSSRPLKTWYFDSDVVYREANHLTSDGGINFLINSMIDLGSTDPLLHLRMVELHEMLIDVLPDTALREQALPNYLQILQIINLQTAEDVYLDDFGVFVNKKALNDSIRRLVIKLESRGLDTSQIKNILI